jgi:hypothetical protein
MYSSKSIIFNEGAVEVVKEVLQCAIAVDQSPEHIANRGKNVKLPADCIQLNGIFKAELQKIWMLMEPTDIYDECHTLSKSSKFTKMIRFLQKTKIPIDAKEVAAWGKEGTANYHTNLLAAMKKVLFKLGMVREEDARIRMEAKVAKLKGEEEPVRKVAHKMLVEDKEDKLVGELREARLFLQTHKVSKLNCHCDFKNLNVLKNH